jgi:hypothetical protein
MTWHEIKESVALLLESQKETDRQLKEARKEADERRKEADERQKETDRQLNEARREADERRKDADRQLNEARREADERRKDTDRQLNEARREADERRREADERRKEADERRKEAEERRKETNRELKEIHDRVAREQEETARQLRELGKQLGGLGDKFGSYTEGLALPAMTKILTQRFHMDVVAARARSQRNGRSYEVDVLAYSESGIDEVYIVEVKSHLREEALDQMKKNLGEFHEFFPGHRNKKVYGILAAVEAPEPVRQKVLREGIYLARIHDGQFELQVPEGFQPRAF